MAILQALADGPKSQIYLRGAAGTPAQGTLRTRLRELTRRGLLARAREEGFPRALDYELAGGGRELLPVLEATRAWLADCPHDPLAFGTQSATSAVKALVEGWSSTLVRALSARALTLTELDGLIAGINYPSLERRLGTMRRTGQIEPLPGRGPGTPYRVTRWLRQGIAPLIAAARWEGRNPAEDTAAIGRLDIEAAFLLALPLVDLGREASGSCRLAMSESSVSQGRQAGVTVGVDGGRIVSCVTNLEGAVDASVSGTAPAWLNALILDEREQLELSGDYWLAGTLVDGLHAALFRASSLTSRNREPGLIP